MGELVSSPNLAHCAWFKPRFLNVIASQNIDTVCHAGVTVTPKRFIWIARRPVISAGNTTSIHPGFAWHLVTQVLPQFILAFVKEDTFAIFVAKAGILCSR